MFDKLIQHELLLTCIEKSLRLFCYIYYRSLDIITKSFKDNNLNSLPLKNLSINKYQYSFHKRSILISYLSHYKGIKSIRQFKESCKLSGAMHDVPLYLLTHTGAYYSSVAHVVLNHPIGTSFYLPVADYLIESSIIKNIEKLNNIGYKIHVGGISDRKFLIRMFKSIKISKIIIFIDLPVGMLMSNNISTRPVIFYGRKSRFFSGPYKLMESCHCCIISHQHFPFDKDILHISPVFEPNSNDDILPCAELHISRSLIDWNYLERMEFFFQ